MQASTSTQAKPIHSKLKWSTIIQRANKKAGKERFRFNGATGEIYEYSKRDRAFLFICNTLDKAAFIDNI